ncbi:MAG TPA: NERD domain-containing protein [Sporosarcina psychrophila]|uniref:NERD domain-containing protein n=1 Tax=Sporosarcina psychrophila TaxID=1476 RepID=A0A921KDN0_SPOPS|nr:NERD domain-containing protein [Sporosarcina psychrophila]
MAQLVKLLDYVSRYEQDLTRYPSQYIRLKRYQWERMKTQWESGADLSEWRREMEEVEEPEESKWFSPLLRVFGQRKDVEAEQNHSNCKEEKISEEDDFGFSLNVIHNPSTLEQLRKVYLDQLFHFQIKWASSTIMDKSRVDSRFLRDTLLRSFAQQLPDNYLLFYYPILLLKKAPVELDIIILTPVECMCITVLEQQDVAAFSGSGDRFWLKKLGEKETKLLSPLIALNRTEKIISGIFKAQEIDFPVRKYLISRNGYIDHPGSAFDVDIIDRRAYDNWFSSLKKMSVPMKSTQFKAGQAILDLGQTTSISRLFGEENYTEEEK